MITQSRESDKTFRYLFAIFPALDPRKKVPKVALFHGHSSVVYNTDGFALCTRVNWPC